MSHRSGVVWVNSALASAVSLWCGKMQWKYERMERDRWSAAVYASDDANGSRTRCWVVGGDALEVLDGKDVDD